MSSYTVNGHVSEGFENVRRQFENNFINGLERNAQLCVYVGEERVVDLWGSADDSNGYDGDSLACIFSSTKSLAAICIATLANKKLLSYSDKVVKHWPEYGNGDVEKESITVADVLRHEGGMVNFTKTLRLVDILRENIKKNSIGRVIEEESLRFPPAEVNTKSEYHGMTRGWLLNEIYRRVDPEKRTIGECLQQDISAPLSADCYIGLAFEQLTQSFSLSAMSFGQVARTSMVPKFLGRKSEVGIFALLKTLKLFTESSENREPALEHMKDTKSSSDLINQFENSVVKIGEIPSANGQCSARGLARIASMMANKGKVEGIEILSEETWNSFHSDHDSKRMHPFGIETNFSQGGVNYFKALRMSPNSDFTSSSENREGYIGWMGFGGSVFQWYPEHKIGFAYVPTLISWEDMENSKAALIQRIVLDCVKEMEKE